MRDRPVLGSAAMHSRVKSTLRRVMSRKNVERDRSVSDGDRRVQPQTSLDGVEDCVYCFRESVLVLL